MEDLIASTLEDLSSAYLNSNGFVPQSILLETIIHKNDLLVNPLDHQTLLQQFYFTLMGTSKSVTLFESKEMEGKIFWRFRLSFKDSLWNNFKHTESHSYLEELQKKVRMLRIQIAKLEEDNIGLYLQKENLKFQLPPDIQKKISLCETSYNVSQSLHSSINEIDTILNELLEKIGNS